MVLYGDRVKEMNSKELMNDEILLYKSIYEIVWNRVNGIRRNTHGV